MKHSLTLRLAALAATGALAVLLGWGGASGDAGGDSILPRDPAALRPQLADKRLVVLLADNSGTETTDLLVPHGILHASGTLEVLIVATGTGPVRLMPALSILPDMTIATFESTYPRGADVVIVPAFHSRGTAETSAFLARQSALDAFIMSICEGAEPVARAGLMAGRVATTHWHAQSRLQRRHPETRWIDNARYVIDGPVMSSSGVSASLPATLALLALLEGHERARATARRFGVADWSASHDSTGFSLDRRILLRALRNRLAIWGHERLHIPLADGFDGVPLALQADAWSRSYRSRVLALNPAGRVTSAQGVTFLTATHGQGGPMLRPLSAGPLAALDASLAAIAARYDKGTADFVARQLEYHWPAAP